jgi:hypothetical protein
MGDTCRQELRQLKADKEEGLLSSPEVQQQKAAALERSNARLSRAGVFRPMHAQGGSVLM